MAKVKGPLHSDEASGSVGKTLTFGKNRGINVVRGTTKPGNPRTPNQQRARLLMRTVGQAITRMNTGAAGKPDGAEETPKQYYQVLVKAPDVWNNLHLRDGYPGGYTDLESDSTEFLALTEPEQTLWRTWNAALRIPFLDVQPITPEVPGYAEVIVAYSFAKTLFRVGYITTFDPAVPPTWDNTVPPAIRKGKMEVRGKPEETPAKKRATTPA